MKLRIENNSLRMRLTVKEVARLAEQGSVDSAIRFSKDRILRYSVSVLASAESVSVHYECDSICVFLPTKMAIAWTGNDEVTIEAFDSGVHLLVEKDFKCLHRSATSEPDAYPNPLA